MTSTGIDTIDTRLPGASATHTSSVTWGDTDAAGHHHNSSIMRWVEAAEVELYGRLGLLAHFPHMPRVQQVVNFTSKLWFGQRVTTTVQVREIGRTSITLEFEVHGEAFEGAERSRAAYGTVTAVHLPPPATHTVPWPDEFSARVDPDGAFAA